MEGNARFSYQFVITEQTYIYCSTPEKEAFQIISQKCQTNLFFEKKKPSKKLNYILI